MHPDDIKFAREIIKERTIQTSYGPGLEMEMSSLREALDTVERYQEALRLIQSADSLIEARLVAFQALNPNIELPT